jgi:hypothetical protein
MLKQDIKEENIDVKSNLLTDYLNRKSCYSCITKTCKRKDPHGYPYPSQFCNYVKYPTNIDEIKRVISNENLLNDFEGKKPYYVICKNVHQECQNCNNLRIKFIDSNKIVLCHGDLDPNRDTITVGIHINLKLTIDNNSKFKIVPVRIHIDGEKLIEKYCNRNLEFKKENKSKSIKLVSSIDNTVSSEEFMKENTVSSEEFMKENTVPSEEFMKENTVSSEIVEFDTSKEKSLLSFDTSKENSFVPINNNVIISDNKLLYNEIDDKSNVYKVSLSDEYKLEKSKNFSIESFEELNFNNQDIPSDIIEHPSPFNMNDDFPSLTPSKPNINAKSPSFSITPLRGNTPIQSPINFSKIKEQTEERIRLKLKHDEINKKENNFQKEYSTEITNSLLDEENRKLKNENIILNNKIKEYENKIKENSFKLETLKDFHKDTNTREYLVKWINNMCLINNSVIETLNSTNYKDIVFVKKIYKNDNDR